MRLRAPITLLVLIGLLLGASYYGWRAITTPTDTSGSSVVTKPTCVKRELFHVGQQFKAQDILVNVYNAGSMAGLASETLDILQRRGFKLGVAGNSPSALSADNVTILTDSPLSPAVKLVAMQFNGPVKVTKGPHLAPGIDVIVGNHFRSVNVKAKTSFTLTKPIVSCVAAGSSAAS
ncbi:MAG: LytR C-terminal domain-containing protein [Nocardioidaceae bacterium]